MLTEILHAHNLEEKVQEQIRTTLPKKGIYIFLEDKTYTEEDLTSQFFETNVAYIKDTRTEVAPHLLQPLQLLKVYAYALNGNTQIGSTSKGMFSVYSKMISLSNAGLYLKEQSITEKGIAYLSTIFQKEVMFDRLIQKVPKKIIDPSQIKVDQKPVKQLRENLIYKLQEQFSTVLEKQEIQAAKTLEVLQKNRIFLLKVLEGIDGLDEKLRLNLIVSDPQELTQIEEEAAVYLTNSLYTGKIPGFFYDACAYFYPSISVNYNDKKPFMYLNRNASTVQINGNEVIAEHDMARFIQVLFLFRSNHYRNGLFYLNNGRIVDHPSIGATRYVLYTDSNNEYSITSQSSISEFNTKASRPFTYSFFHYPKLNDSNGQMITIHSYEELAKIIFFGSKKNSLSNQFYVSSKIPNNHYIQQKYFTKTKEGYLTGDSKEYYDLILQTGTYEIKEVEVKQLFERMRKDLIFYTNLDQSELTVSQSLLNYKNMLAFWDGLLNYPSPSFRKVNILNIKSDSDYMLAIIQLTLDVFYTVNRHMDKSIFDATHVQQIVNAKTSTILLNNLKYYKRQHQYIYTQIDKEKWVATHPPDEFYDPHHEDYLTIALKQLDNYRPKQTTIQKTDILYALVSFVGTEIKKLTNQKENGE